MNDNHRPAESAEASTRFRPVLSAMVFVVLFAIAIPWYWAWLPISPRAIWWGVPAWFAVAVLGSLAISVTTAWQLRHAWPDADADAPDADGLEVDGDCDRE